MGRVHGNGILVLVQLTRSRLVIQMIIIMEILSITLNITGDGSAKSFYALNTKNLAEFG